MLMTVNLGDGGSGGAPSAVSLEIDPQQLYATAERFKVTADNLMAAVETILTDLGVEAPGSDTVSKGVATFFNGLLQSDDGAPAQIRKAAKNLYDVADGMRAMAASYGLAEGTNVADLTARS